MRCEVCNEPTIRPKGVCDECASAGEVFARDWARSLRERGHGIADQEMIVGFISSGTREWLRA